MSYYNEPVPVREYNIIDYLSSLGPFGWIAGGIGALVGFFVALFQGVPFAGCLVAAVIGFFVLPFVLALIPIALICAVIGGILYLIYMIFT